MEAFGLQYDWQSLLSVLAIFQWTITIAALLLWTLAGFYLLFERRSDTESLPSRPKR